MTTYYDWALNGTGELMVLAEIDRHECKAHILCAGV